MRSRSLDQKKHAKDVGLERPFQLFLGNVGDVLIGMLLACIVDHDVELAELGDHPRHRVVAECLVADVPGDGQRARPFVADDLCGFFGIVMLAQVEDGDVRALARIERSDGATDPAVGTGDEGDLALQTAGTRIARLPFGLRIESRFMARQLIFMDHFDVSVIARSCSGCACEARDRVEGSVNIRTAVAQGSGENGQPLRMGAEDQQDRGRKGSDTDQDGAKRGARRRVTELHRVTPAAGRVPMQRRGSR
ncbi:hypothetical protein SPHINGOAX6_30082 [Sphingomonas sp. AX6]|nr:hypothetical protein SPHINGOAX6_30082 [Sphingomonas sp. AX6]